MNALDWTLVGVYMAAMVGLSVKLGAGQASLRAYFLSDQRQGPWPVALSTMATQCSTNSLLGVPAFVAFSTAGGLVWLQYELALPVAMVALMGLLYPVYRRLGLISVYGYLERRFGRATAMVVSLCFQVLRAVATAVTLYGVSLVLVAVLDIPFWLSVALLGGVTLAYDLLGGMRAVIWSDVVQMVVLTLSIVVAVAFAVDAVGGVDRVLQLVDPSRIRALRFEGHGLGDGQTFSLLPMFFGGLFLYVAYYGCDQTQVQRGLSARSLKDTQRALLLGGLLRFPVVACYCALGLCIAAYASSTEGFLGALRGADGTPNYNLAVPTFVLQALPHGLIGLVVVGLFAAAMSSLDSALNSMSAATVQDVIKPLLREAPSESRELALARITTAAWGVVCLCLTFFVGGISPTVLEAVNKVGSLLNGPLLAIFSLGMLTRRVDQPAALGGLGIGFASNAALWLTAPSVSWLWWNVTGYAVACTVALSLSLRPRSNVSELDPATLREPSDTKGLRWASIVLVGYALLLLAFLALL